LQRKALHWHHLRKALHWYRLRKALHWHHLRKALHWHHLRKALHWHRLRKALHWHRLRKALHWYRLRKALHWHRLRKALHWHRLRKALHSLSDCLADFLSRMQRVNEEAIQGAKLPTVQALKKSSDEAIQAAARRCKTLEKQNRMARPISFDFGRAGVGRRAKTVDETAMSRANRPPEIDVE
jgi:hypothetical protein